MNEGVGLVEQFTPYLLSNDDRITAILLVCFLITSYVLSHGRTLLFQSIRKLFSPHGIEHLFHKQTVVDTYCLLLLNLQVCLLVSVLLLKFLSDSLSSHTSFFGLADNPPLSLQAESVLTDSVISALLACYSIITVSYLVVKRYAYKFINWVFFDKAKNILWIESYFFIISIFGMLLLPVTLLVVYCNLPLYVGIIIPVLLFLLMNFLFIYKCFSIFFSQQHGLFCLFLYFCTLEVLPLLVVWKGIEKVNDIFL